MLDEETDILMINIDDAKGYKKCKRAKQTVQFTTAVNV